MSRRRDITEAGANALAGLGVSLLLVEGLRLAGIWDAPSPVIAAVFFAASVARAYALRRLFRRADRA